MVRSGSGQQACGKIRDDTRMRQREGETRCPDGCERD
jgi:hypothetical protein